MAQQGMLTEPGFRDLHHRYQTGHALAGRARRCGCCEEWGRARRFDGPALICNPCSDDIEAQQRWEDETEYADAPSDSNAWCQRGCQPLCGLGECGNCGYVGPGVPEEETDNVIDLCGDGRYHLVPREAWERE